MDLKYVALFNFNDVDMCYKQGSMAGKLEVVKREHLH